MTILYNAKKWLGYKVIFKGKGSVLFQPRTIFSACVSGMVAAVCSLHRVEVYLNDAVRDPSVFFSAISFLLGFVLVYRAQEAYSRHWRATCDTQAMFSHLRSLAIMMRTWTPNVSLQLRFLTRLRVFAIIACDLLRAKPTDYDFLLCSRLVTPDEALLLIGKRNRAGICISWISDIIAMFISAAHKAQKMDRHHPLYKEISQPGRGHSYARQPEKVISFVADPQLGVLFQELNMARDSYEQAKLVADIPYPFPYTQLSVFALAFYCLFLPVLVASFVPDGTLSVLFCFITTLFTQAVSNVAMELENPFEGKYHSIPLDYHLASFSEFIHDLVSTQLPGTELSGKLTLGKVRGIERRLSVLPHQLGGHAHPAIFSVENQNHAKSETPMSKRQIGGVQAQPRNSYAATPTVSRLQRRTSLAAILAAAGGEKEKKPSGTPVPGAASTAKLHSVVVNDAATKTRPTASAGSFDRNLPRRARSASTPALKRSDGREFDVLGSQDDANILHLERTLAAADAAVQQMKGSELILQGINLALVRKRKGFTVVT